MEKENKRPNARVKLQTLSKSVSKMFKQGEIVWVNLGISFSWWPGEFQEVAVEKGKKTCDLDIDINVSENPFKNITSNSGDTVLDTDGGLQTRKKPKEEVANDTNAKKDPFKKVLGYVRFFDDGKYDLYRVTDFDNVRSYTCKDKQEFVIRGLAKFAVEEGPVNENNSGFDFRARQAQFYKDVEMAEVLTENDIEIANLLAQWEVVESADEEQPKPPPKKKRKKKRKN